MWGIKAILLISLYLIIDGRRGNATERRRGGRALEPLAFAVTIAPSITASVPARHSAGRGIIKLQPEPFRHAQG